MAAAVLLTIFFGPFGLLYSTLKGAVIMFILLLISMFLVPAGAGGWLFFLLWFATSFWGAAAAAKYNKKMNEIYLEPMK